MVQQIKSQIIGWRKFLNKDLSSQKVFTARNHNNNDNSKIKVVIITMTKFIISIKNFYLCSILYFLPCFFPTYWPAPSWLASSVGRALHRYRRGDGFKSPKGPNFLQRKKKKKKKSSVLNCEDFLNSFLHCSANIWISYI